MIFKKKKKLSLEEQIAKSRKSLKKTRVIHLLKILFITLGVIGGISYLSSEQNTDTLVNKDVLIENRTISYIRDYYASDEDVYVDDISIVNIDTNDDEKIVETSFKLNDMAVSADVILDENLNVLNELVVSPREESTSFKKDVELDTVKNLTDSEEKEAKSFAQSYFSSLNTNNATIFYSDAPILSGYTQYDLDTLKLIDGGVTKENLIDIYVNIDYVFYDQEEIEIFRETQDVEIVYNSDSKVIQSVEY